MYVKCFDYLIIFLLYYIVLFIFVNFIICSKLVIINIKWLNEFLICFFVIEVIILEEYKLNKWKYVYLYLVLVNSV